VRSRFALSTWAFALGLMLAPATAAQAQEVWDPVLGSVATWGRVFALAVMEEPEGVTLFAGGDFTSMGGVAANRVAQWNGAEWSPLGSGVNASVNALTVFDDGSGPALYVGGFFSIAGGVPAPSIARWDGTSWSAVGEGTNGTVSAMVVFDDGSGEALYVGGSFTQAGGAPASRIARWNGKAWSSLPALPAPSGWVRALAVHDDGSGPALFIGRTNDVVRWTGAAWQTLGDGFSGSETSIGLRTLLSYDDGSGPALYAGGGFTSSGPTPLRHLARWNGLQWEDVGGGVDDIFPYSSVSSMGLGVSNPFVRVLAAATDPDGTRVLYVGGLFAQAGGQRALNLARWDGQSLQPVGSGTNRAVQAAHSTGGSVFIGGDFAVAAGRGSHLVARFAILDPMAVSGLSITGDPLDGIISYSDSRYVLRAAVQTFAGETFDATEAVTWSSDDESIATISPLGVVTAKSAGATVIRAEYDGTSSVVPFSAIFVCQENGYCCTDVCAVDPACCAQEWDAACAALAAELCTVYRMDDGYQTWGVGGAIKRLVWLNQFEVVQGAELITHIEAILVSSTASISLHVWSDPDQDGDPSDAYVLTCTPVIAPSGSPGNQVFVSHAVPPVYVGPPGTKYFVGGLAFTNASSMGGLPARFDDSTPAPNNWIAKHLTTGPTPDPNDLSALEPVPFFYAWMVRARATAGSPDQGVHGPASLCPCIANFCPLHDLCDGVLVLSGSDNLQVEFSTFHTSTAGPPEPLCDVDDDDQVHHDLWYAYEAACDGLVTIGVCDADYAAKLALYPPMCFDEPGGALACDVNSCDGQPQITVEMVAGEYILIRVGGQNGQRGSGVLTIACGSSPPCPADLNGDGAVDVFDLLALLGAWGECNDPGNCPADLTRDGSVDVFDLLALLGAWGEC
jgi:hypothetical protein